MEMVTYFFLSLLYTHDFVVLTDADIFFIFWFYANSFLIFSHFVYF